MPTWRGRVEVRLSSPGSKSERPAAWLVTDRGALLLRRVGAPALGDEELLALDGASVACTGRRDEVGILATHIVRTDA